MFSIKITSLLLLCIWGIDGEFICPRPRGYFPHPHQCKKYYVCMGNKSSLQTCPDQMLFDVNRRSCFTRSKVKCGDRLQEDKTEMPVNSTHTQHTVSGVFVNITVNNTTPRPIDYNVTTVNESKWITNNTSGNVTDSASNVTNVVSDFITGATRTVNVSVSKQDWTTEPGKPVNITDLILDINSTTVPDISSIRYTSLMSTQSTSKLTTEGDANKTDSTTERVLTTLDDEESTTERVLTTLDDEESTTERVLTTLDDDESTTERVLTTLDDEESTTESVLTTLDNEESTTERVLTTLDDDESTTGRVLTTLDDEESTTERVLTTLSDHESTTKRIQTTLSDYDDYPLPDIICPEAYGLYPHPTDRHKYIHCQEWYPHILTCPGNLVFDNIMKVCVWRIKKH
ncbi:glutamate--tRNA ligase-like [Centruroides vittatus]|uniref:glutamate--tRNA ligase-like n=1 Tax=Centruroides vittatus TaxID=120091 RepID=UPI0035103FE8